MVNFPALPGGVACWQASFNNGQVQEPAVAVAHFEQTTGPAAYEYRNGTKTRRNYAMYLELAYVFRYLF